MDKYQPLRDAIAAIPRGWGNAFDEARKHPDEDGIAQVGSVDEDQRLYPVIEVNCGEYYGPEDSLPLARYIAAADPGTIAALLAENKELRDALEFVAGAYDMYASVGDNSLAFYEAYSVARAALNRANTGDQR